MASHRPGRQLPINPYASQPLEHWRVELHGVGTTEARYRAFVAITELQAPRAAIPDVMTILADPDGDLRAAATNWCARMLSSDKLFANDDRFEDFVTILSANQHDSDPDVQLAAVRALSWIVPPPAGLADQVLELLARDDIQSTSQSVLAELCGRLPGIGESGIAHLRQLLNAEQAEVREAAAGAFAAMGERARGAMPELIVALDDEEPVVREHAAKTLGQFFPRTDEIRQALEFAARDEDPGVAEAANQALSSPSPS